MIFLPDARFLANEKLAIYLTVLYVERILGQAFPPAVSVFICFVVRTAAGVRGGNTPLNLFSDEVDAVEVATLNWTLQSRK